MIRIILLSVVLALPAISASYAQCEPCQQAYVARKRASAATARREFQRLHPCPTTLSTIGPCPAWLIDHLIPLACGGPESLANMFWQTTEEMAVKDREEIVICKVRQPQRQSAKRVAASVPKTASPAPLRATVAAPQSSALRVSN